jgi:cystathionine beta-lyase
MRIDGKSKYDFDTVYNRKGTGCFKADALQMLFGKEDLLSFWVADMDIAIAPEIQSALEERLNHPILGYNFRLAAYYDAIINWVGRRYHWNITRDWIINTPGIVTAINVAIVTLTQPNDGVLIQTPVYDPFFEAVKKNGRTLLTNSLIPVEDKFEIDFEDLEAKLKQAKLFILCSPHNPVGRVWTEAELLQIGRLCKKYGVIVIADEIHADLIYSGNRFVAFGSLEDFAEFTIACYSPSKSFNLAGLCTSAIVIPNDKLRDKFNAYVQIMHLYLGNSFGITALEAAYSKGEAWLSELISYLEINLDYLCSFFKSKLPHLKIYKPQGTYLAWIDCNSLNLSDKDLFQLLVDNGIAVNMGKTYGAEGSGYIRVNFGCPHSLLKQACEILYVTLTKG